MTPFSSPPNPEAMEGNVGIDANQAVYVVRTGETAEVITWDVVIHNVWSYATELLIDPPPTVARGSIEAYDTMLNLQAALKARFDRTGERACSELSSGLSGLEGKRVRALTADNTVREFIVGVTDGWLPHHVEIRLDGPAVRAARGYERVWVRGKDY